MSKKIYLANPRGFCAGVDRAIGIVEKALEQFGAPIYVRHEVVHNKFVVDGLRDRGAVFVQELDEVPDDAIVIFSAHGVAKAVQMEADRRGLKVFDATCPLVTKVHMEVSRDAKNARDTILIGHAGHPEVEGTMGQFDAAHGGEIYLVEDVKDADNLVVNNPDNVSYVTQTTLSIDDTKEIIDRLRARFPVIAAPKKDDICYATQNRQDAVRELSKQCSLIFVVGSKNSSNSNRLRELAEKQGAMAYLIDRAEDIDLAVLKDHDNIGVTAGASAPEVLVQEVIELLEKAGATLEHSIDENPETIVFPLPKELRD
ncbi:4-hydroxy-3-methylbut-2-enyl diphosphate reductase [Wohlfahrtiimonas chitiniclastica SH04]|uniref:4-hydroxy-3-methylbut-2-enyl diphosphate reductase n=1 Tax=Wohlfahrtiimonas chitiniclastica SH04 TaxID=1261130 RepID=L8XZ26_9GAMM|nr:MULTISPECIES: 4-hydroxy-3-methylbut-2-enyl diphosphate reductase [Wohlfahrtiimonas]ELV08074.1 4-hydroxy-3-methylbut-2-enyl diphosphate reductase [Wohlfahrtiimonas chitiniclastica SH04]OYQ73332.1 4-hydroxy-3-methylbut-2-enyl diphosphate reductase [Wohlfahrtiimonas sp. G9077]OYQ74859.1 4-hydroxy-3-methylbut-2-enyl diphosphate reductase [Wohlfahrtiimonas chitiniclastica]